VRARRVTAQEETMARVQEVRLGSRDVRQLEPFIGEERMQSALEIAERMRKRLAGRTIWNINSTAVGGGVAEMLEPLLSYSKSVDLSIRWLVIGGDPEFYRLTKRIHHALHGSTGDGSELGERARRVYEATLRENEVELESFIQPGDVVILHDPQTAGLAPRLQQYGAHVIWRCHIGHDKSGDQVDAGWNFLAPYLKDVPAYVFSRKAYAPSFLEPDRVHVIQPSIDALSPKNQELSDEATDAILVQAGLLEGPPPDHPPAFTRTDGSQGLVERSADLVRLGRAPTRETPMVVQISRWDPLKDMLGVMQGFAAHVTETGRQDIKLLLAGPDVKGVTDDPEGPAVFQEVFEAWQQLPEWLRKCVDLAMLPTSDIEENAALVNAIQRHASVVTQKSLHEGFGLTVTEAMWKSRPVIASAVGGIQDQIDDGVHGLLIRDPEDLEEFEGALATLLGDPERAERMGQAARERVREQFLGIRHLLQYADLLGGLR
jgi:trehalose synthase